MDRTYFHKKLPSGKWGVFFIRFNHEDQVRDLYDEYEFSEESDAIKIAAEIQNDYEKYVQRSTRTLK